jgi:hypothetical protein
MNLCDACETAAHCLRNGCIPITYEDVGTICPLCQKRNCPDAMAHNMLMTACEPNWFERVGRFIPFRKPAPLKFPEILPNLLPTKETTA